MFIYRKIFLDVKKSIKLNPVTAIIGARQVGKSTLAKEILKEINDSLYIDLEKPSDKILLSEPEEFFKLHKNKCICIDEIQLSPDIFPVIRSFSDEYSSVRFLILGSASPELLRQSSETLAGRIAYFELSPFLYMEVKDYASLHDYRVLGGFPKSILANDEVYSFDWLRNFVKTFLERDLQSFGFNIPSETILRLWKMIAHINGQVINYSRIGNSLGASHTTIKHYIDILHKTFMLRVLTPYHVNIKKRLIKSPKIYIRDTGILNALLNITTYEELFSHPVYGSSWEITVIENIINKYENWDSFYYRTAKGVEIDLVLTKANRIIAIEIKTSSSPSVTKGFWTALDDINSTEAYIIAPVNQKYPLKNNVWVYPLDDFLHKDLRGF